MAPPEASPVNREIFLTKTDEVAKYALKETNMAFRSLAFHLLTECHIWKGSPPSDSLLGSYLTDLTADTAREFFFQLDTATRYVNELSLPANPAVITASDLEKGILINGAKPRITSASALPAEQFITTDPQAIMELCKSRYIPSIQNSGSWPKLAAGIRSYSLSITDHEFIQRLRLPKTEYPLVRRVIIPTVLIARITQGRKIELVPYMSLFSTWDKQTRTKLRTDPRYFKDTVMDELVQMTQGNTL